MSKTAQDFCYFDENLARKHRAAPNTFHDNSHNKVE